MISLIILRKYRAQRNPPYDTFSSKFLRFNPFDAEYNLYVNLLKNGMTTEQAVVKLKLLKPPPTGVENYQYLQKKEGATNNFNQIFWRWYKNEHIVPTLEAVQKKIAFHHNEDINMIKPNCLLSNLANICLHKSTKTIFYPFTEADKDLMEKFQENIGFFYSF